MDISAVENLIDKIALEKIKDSSEDWDLSDDRENLVYSLAYNDGILDFADTLKKWFRENTTPQEEGAKDGADQGTD